MKKTVLIIGLALVFALTGSAAVIGNTYQGTFNATGGNVVTNGSPLLTPTNAIYYASLLTKGLSPTQTAQALNAVMTNPWPKEVVIDTPLMVARATSTPYPYILQIGSNTKLRALPNCVITVTNGVSATALQSWPQNGNAFTASNIVVSDVTINCNGTNQTRLEYDDNVSPSNFGTTNFLVCGMWFSGVTDIVLERCRVIACPCFYYAFGGHAKNVTMRDCISDSRPFYSNNGDAIKVWGASTNIFVENHIMKGSFGGAIGLSADEATQPWYPKALETDLRRGTNQGAIEGITFINPRWEWDGRVSPILSFYFGGQGLVNPINNVTIIGGYSPNTLILGDLEDFVVNKSLVTNLSVINWRGPMSIHNNTNWHGVYTWLTGGPLDGNSLPYLIPNAVGFASHITASSFFTPMASINKLTLYEPLTNAVLQNASINGNTILTNASISIVNTNYINASFFGSDEYQLVWTGTVFTNTTLGMYLTNTTYGYHLVLPADGYTLTNATLLGTPWNDITTGTVSDYDPVVTSYGSIPTPVVIFATNGISIRENGSTVMPTLVPGYGTLTSSNNVLYWITGSGTYKVAGP